jgi:hypothetical protein
MSRYLRPVAGVDARIWVAPSRGQLFWLRHAPALFAPVPGAGGRLARWCAIATVTPSTNVTGLNLRYQAYLNNVFHRTRLARIGHAVCMPLIVTALLAVLCPVRLGAVNASLPAAAALAVWWACWARIERDALWGAGAVALAGLLYLLANAATVAYPWMWLLLGSLLQAGSHILEPLPPRVTRSLSWVPVGEYLRGPAGRRHPAGTVLRRAGQLAAQTVFGTVDELVASPRLLPVLLLELLWLFGHDPERRAAWRAQVAAAIASGNPALDYVGTGGGTPLRIPDQARPSPR